MRLVGVVCGVFALGCQIVPFELPSGESGDGFGEPTPDPVYNCQPGDADSCGAGKKCAALDNAGVQNQYDCVDDDGSVVAFGECVTAPSTGQDGCMPGFGCMPNEDGGLAGFCLPLCRTDLDCGAGYCIPTAHVQVPVCADECNPLLGGCPVVTRCLPDLDRYVCRYADGDDGLDGDTCDGLRNSGCAEGLVCQQGLVLNGCTAADCCTALCDLDATQDPCQLPETCVPLFNDPSPILANVGACVAEQ